MLTDCVLFSNIGGEQVNNSFSSSFWEAGAVTFTCIILIVNLKIAMRQERWTVR
jgi:hypothetical protein